VSIGADISRLGSSLKEAEGQIDGFIVKTEAAGAALGRVALIAGAVGAALVGVLALSTRAAGQAQFAQEKLNNAILGSGKAIDKAKLERLAAALQKTTAFSDETILSMQSLLITFGSTEKQVERLSPLLLDVSARLGIDLNTAARAFSKAMAGSEGALQRFGIGIGDNIDLLRDFDGSMRRLESRFSGAAVAAGNTFFGALSKLRNAFSELQESIGAPLLQPLTLIINAFASLVNGVAGLIKAFPILGPIVGGIIGGLALLALTVALVTAAMSVAGPATAAWGLIVGVLSNGVSLLNGRLVILAANVSAFKVLLGAGLVGVIVAVTLAIIQWVRANDDANKGMTELMLRVDLFFAKLSGPRGKKAVETLEQAIRDLNEAHARAKEGFKGTTQSAEEMARSMLSAKEAVKLLRLEEERAAAGRASDALKKAGNTEADIKAIERRRVADVRAAQQKELNANIKQNLHDLNLHETTAERKKEILIELEDQRGALAQLALQNDQEVADETVSIEKRAAEKRLKIDSDKIDQEMELEQQKLTDITRLESVRESNRAAVAQRAFATQRLEEELRIGMLTRMAALEKSLQKDILDTRLTLINVQNKRLEAQFITSEARRADLVRQGFLSEGEAARQSAVERFDIEQQKITAELSLLKKREEALEQQFIRDKEIALATFTSKVAQLKLESDAQKAALDSQQKLREIDLKASVAIGEAETKAKISQLDLGLKAALKVIELELKAKEKAGAIPEGTAAAFAEESKTLEAEFRQTTDSLTAAQAQRSAAVTTLLAEQNKEVVAQKNALDKQNAIQQEVLKQQLGTDLANAVQTRNANLRDLAQQAANLGVDVAGFVAEQRRLTEEMFERGDIVPEERRRRLAFLDGLNDEVSKVTDVATGKLKTTLEDSKSLYTNFAEAVTAKLQPVADLIKQISDPAALAGLISSLFAANNLRPGAAAQAGAAPNITQNVDFSFQGVTMRLTADEQAVMERVIKRLLGPDGERLYSILQASQGAK
jgi:hypothetical protein